MRRNKVVNFAAEAAVWTLLAAIVEVSVTATVERWSMGSRYVLAREPWYSLQGHTTLWDVVDGVALAASLRLVVRFFNIHQLRWWQRGLVTIPLIYALEFVGGLFFNKLLEMDLWDYSQYVWHGVPLHILGQITLVYAPFWFLAGVFMPAVYRAVHGVAPFVGDQIELFGVDQRR